MTVAPTPVQHRVPHSNMLLGIVIGAVLASIVAFLVVHYRSSSSSSTVQGSGNAVSQVRTVPPFTSVELAGSNNVTVTVGSPQKVVVRGDDNLVGHVTTRVEGGNLVIGTKPGSFSTRTPMSMAVTVPALGGFTLSGSGTATISGISTQVFKLALPGSGVINASGTTQRLDAVIAGSGEAGVVGLKANDVHASVSGSGTIMLTALDSLDAAISGSGSIIYLGSPAHVTKSVSGSGAIVGG